MKLLETYSIIPNLLSNPLNSNNRKEMEITDIDVICILVQLKNGNAHQLLTTKENKRIAIELIGRMDGKLSLSEEIASVKIEPLNS